MTAYCTRLRRAASMSAFSLDNQRTVLILTSGGVHDERYYMLSRARATPSPCPHNVRTACCIVTACVVMPLYLHRRHRSPTAVFLEDAAPRRTGNNMQVRACVEDRNLARPRQQELSGFRQAVGGKSHGNANLIMV